MLNNLAVTVLGLLTERDMHPYEVAQLAQARRGGLHKVSPSSVYHVIGKLDDAGFIRETGTDREGNRPERTRYGITEAGRAAFLDRISELLEQVPAEFPEFPFALSEAHNLEPERAAELLEQRAHQLADRLAAKDERLAEYARRGGARDLRVGRAVRTGPARA